MSKIWLQRIRGGLVVANLPLVTFGLLLTGFTSFIFNHTASAQPSYPPPTGVYCSCGPTTGVGNGSVDPLIAAKSFVNGILVRVGWERIESSDGSCNWTLIDGQIAAANKFGKKISLGIGCGIAIPQWVFDAGAKRLVATVPIRDTIAVPWDKVFLEKWTRFISALGARYKNDTTINLVYMTNSTGNGFEMQLPFVTVPALADAGYTDAMMIASWKSVMDAFRAAFPNHYLTNDFHPVNGSNAVADSVYAYAVSSIGSRYGANAWWWTQKNALSVYPSQYDILLQSAKNNVFTGVQFAYNGSLDSAKFGPGGMPEALRLAIDSRVCYWEIWNQDILNPKFDSLLSHAACSGATGFVNDTDPRSGFQIYPNPCNGMFVAVLHDLHEGLLLVHNTLGSEVFRKQYSREESVTIDLSHCDPGLYLLSVIAGDRRLLNSKLIITR
jgi:hypothetical protein